MGAGSSNVSCGVSTLLGLFPNFFRRLVVVVARVAIYLLMSLSLMHHSLVWT